MLLMFFWIIKTLIVFLVLSSKIAIMLNGIQLNDVLYKYSFVMVWLSYCKCVRVFVRMSVYLLSICLFLLENVFYPNTP